MSHIERFTMYVYSPDAALKWSCAEANITTRHNEAGIMHGLNQLLSKRS